MNARSRITALINVVDNLRLKLDDNCIAFLVLLNHTKAFDPVDHKVLLRKLQTFHFSNSACDLIRSYLINSSQRVYLNGKISKFAERWTRHSLEVNIRASFILCIY